MKGDMWNLLPLRKKVLICFSVIIIVIGLLSSVLYYTMSQTYSQISAVYNNLKILEAYSARLDKISGYLDQFLANGDRSYISVFYQAYEEQLYEMNNTPLRFIKKEDTLLFQNICHMFETYGSEADSAINEYRKRNMGISSSRLSRALKIQDYMKESIRELILSYISQSRLFQEEVLNQLLVLRTFITVLIITAVLLYLLLAVYFDRALVKPINALVELARKISHGEFDIEKAKVSSHSELKILGDTLCDMAFRIKDHIGLIQQKSEVEKLLQIKDMENLKVNALLQEAELKRLQAQINPHFLFNTLTTLHHTAFMEGALETCEIAEAISKILRYNLRISNTVVQLKDEIENIRYYLYIQEKRYKHRVKVHFDIDKSLLDLPIPNMTVQPIVENSFIHGIENSESGGGISVKVYREQSSVVVEVRDNGVGIETARLEQIRGVLESGQEYIGHTSSIGIQNVVKRLQAFYSTKDVFIIESVPKQGTIIKLMLPDDFRYKIQPES